MAPPSAGLPRPRSSSPTPSDTSHSGELDTRPRILCLHGGGVTGPVFRCQCRVLIRALPDFRLVFADGPFPSEAGPGIGLVYGEWGPFRRWLRFLPTHSYADDETTVRLILSSLERCKSKDAGAGPWVGMLGFSQGAKVAASLLYDQQIRLEKDGKLPLRGDVYRFGVLMAGRGPLISLCEHSRSPALQTPSQLSTQPVDYDPDTPSPHILRIPTIHVHGLQDQGIELHRQLADRFCDPNTSTIIEWDGDHRIPIKSPDVSRITQEIYRIAREQRIID